MPIILRSTELQTFGITDTIYRDLLCCATGVNLSIEGGGNSVAIKAVKHLSGLLL